MTKDESIDKLKERYRWEKYRIEKSLPEIIQEKPWEFDALSGSSLWMAHEMCFLYYNYIEKDITKAKQELYTCGTLTNYGVLRFGNWPDGKSTGTSQASSMVSTMAFDNHFSYILLSDNAELIKQYSELSHRWMEQQLKEGFTILTRAVQCVLRDDWEELLRIMPYFDKAIKRSKYPVLSKDFFLAMMENDQKNVKEILELMVSPKQHSTEKRNNPFIANFISFPASGYTKLAWLKGMEIEIDSPYIPMELMPIRPLAEYINPYKHFWRLGAEMPPEQIQELLDRGYIL